MSQEVLEKIGTFPLPLLEVRAVVSKRGVDDGNQKGGGSLQPAKENHNYYKPKKRRM